MNSIPATAVSTGLLEDTPTRDYSVKLRLFNAFAQPELRRAISDLGLQPGMHCLDAGCGTGEAMTWLLDAVEPGGSVSGIDLATAHVDWARRICPSKISILRADLRDPPLPRASLDLIWCVNTVNHLREPVAHVRRLATLLRPGGRLVLGQSCLLPDMVFAWDSRLEYEVNQAVRRYYHDRYRLSERELTAVRSLVGILREAGLRGVVPRTYVLERVAPVSPTDEAYLLEAIFRGTWGERLRPYLSPDDYSTIERLCAATGPEYALRRPDFHFLQTFTVTTGVR